MKKTEVLILRVALPLVMVCVSFGQVRAGSIVGTVQMPDGREYNGGARVVAMRLPDSEKDEVFQTGFALSGKDGGFRLEALAAGRYEVCVSALSGEFIEECDWGKAAAVVAVRAGQESRSNLRLVRGVFTWVELEDNGKLLEQHEGKSNGGVLHLGVITQRGDTLPMRPGQTMDGKKSYWVVVPETTRFRLDARSPLFEIESAEDSGESLSSLQAQREFAAGQGAKRFRLRLRGLKSVEAAR
ncbi:carboxypeptidase-like regulatory domain-containing protein [Nostoc sp. NIES-2111]